MSTCRLMLALDRKRTTSLIRYPGGRRPSLLLPCLGGLYIIYWSISQAYESGSPLPLSFGLAIFALMCGFSTRTIPPAILLLGAGSSVQEFNLYDRVAATIMPCRTVTLLDTGDLRPDLRNLSERSATTFAGNLRLRDGDEWRPLVKRLMGVSRLLVIDARTMSEGVYEEIQWIRSDAVLMAKTLWIIDPGRPIDSLLPGPPAPIRTFAGEEGLLEFLKSPVWRI